MFSWICPQCGSEVPPAYSDCPNCKPVQPEAPKTVAAPPPPSRPQPAAPAPRTMAMPTRPIAPPTPTAPPAATYVPPAQPQPAAPAVQPVQYAAYPAPQRGMPAWLVTAGVFLGLMAVGYAFYALVLNKQGSGNASAATQMETKADAAKSKKGNGIARHLEVAGIRILEEGRRPSIRLMLVNHSSADLSQLSGTIVLATDQAEVASIPFKLASLGAYEAKDISAPLKTTLRAYEMPDWQFIKAQVQLDPSSAGE